MRKLFSSADRALAQRIEAADAATGLAVAQSTARANPQLGAAAEPHLGGYAVFGGVGSPMTHAMGIGMSGPVDAAAFDRMEEFFRSRGSASLIDLCPLVDPTVLQLVMDRGYRIIELNNVLVREIDPNESFPEPPDHIRIERVRPEQEALWTLIVTRGFLEKDDVPEEHLAMMSGASGMADCFLAFVHGQPVGGAAAGVRKGVAGFYGDATIVAARGRGVQSRLIEHRLAHAARSGADLAVASVIPGSASNRNYERCGFQLVYMRVNVMREWG